MIVHVHPTYCHLIFFMIKEMPKIVVFVVKRYAVREANVRVRKAKKGRLSVGKGMSPSW